MEKEILKVINESDHSDEKLAELRLINKVCRHKIAQKKAR